MNYLRDAEFKMYTIVLLFVASASIAYLYTQGVIPEFSEAFRQGLFHAVSIATTAGFTTSEFRSMGNYYFY